MLSKPLFRVSQYLQPSIFKQSQLNSKTIYYFCKQNNNINNSENQIIKEQANEIESQKIKKPKTEYDNPLEEMKDKYVYSEEKVKQVTNPKLVDRIKKIEDEKMNENTWAFDGIRFPLVLVIGSLIIYHTWQTIPFGVAYRHFSHSEYIPRNNHIHAIFLGNLSFQNTGQLMVYFPIMAGSLLMTAKFFKQRHMFYLFVSNSLLTYGVTYLYERNKVVSPMITPKSHGSATALAFLSAQFAMKPDLLIYGSRALPFFIIPATIYMYEVWEYQNGYINEVCRPAHFASIAYGIVFGLLFKRFCYVQPRKVF